MTSIPAITSLFGTAAKCYRAVSEAILASKHERNLYYKFRIEEARFVLWCRSWGYSQGLTDSGQLGVQLKESAGLIQIRSILEHMVGTFTDAEKLKSRFGFVINIETSGLDPHSPGFNPTSFQNPDPLIDSQKVPPKINRLSIFLMNSHWSVSNKSASMLFIKDIKDFNDGIYALIPRTTQETLSRALPAEILSSMEEEGELRSIAETASEEYPRLQKTADFKRVCVEKVPAWRQKRVNLEKTLEIRKNTIDMPYYLDPPPHQLMYASRQYSRYYELGRRTHYNYGDCLEERGALVLIEWKSYTPKDTRPEIFSHVESLARLLHATPKPPDVNVLECIGWFRFSVSGRFRVAFVYKPPPPFAEYQARQSLHTLLDKTKIPSLEDRFNLAKALARAVLQIHSAGWLHGDIRSNNIIFFSTKPGLFSHADPLHWELESPYITGFSYSGEWDPILADHKMPYHHPHYNPYTPGAQPLGPNRGTISPSPTALRPFKQRCDVYSLGCVLLEIGLWERLDRMHKPGPGWGTKLRGHVNELGGKCGATYQGIAEWCLMIDRKEGPKGGGVLKEFVWEVLDKLENLRA